VSRRPPTTGRTARRANERASRRSSQTTQPRRSAPAEPPRRPVRPWLVAVAAVVVLGAAAAGFVLATSGAPNGTAGSPAPSASAGASASAGPSASTGTAGTSAAVLPGVSTALPPWPPETANLAARLQAIGLPVLSAEGTVLHIHQHIDIYVDGQPVTVPADIGINVDQQYLSPIHTHDSTGIIHVESPTQRDFTLGEFFDVWGVRFDAHCIGGACDGNGRTLSVYVNGQLVTGDPRAVTLAAHQEIVVALGTPSQLPSPIPSSYPFPAGY
jgi:hypothetical protein